MRTILLAMLLLNVTSLSDTQKSEIRQVEERLLAPCCYTQSIAVHGSEIAGQMRAEVTEMVVHGRTENEIVNYYRNLYGDRVLVVPDGVTGEILFSLPVIIVVFGCLVLLLCVRKMLRSRQESQLLAEKQTRRVIDKAIREMIERETGEPL
ncbi:MAG TPA: cytochrome c-type biogenesis protein CcmH [Candidatus Sulfotelmatobacter sp.]|nr:cytochrome c-type biogenesis protein CcmH [Candidatus Sulfotelmatobacter sp.]